ncbi:hypothetical protein FN846DRAFT_906781 [Sphaerosporella brunnea]|uniref:Uncharacterized protein n=1 Tax=Sphaerosporella brunnea TaxID=1250544 RepID=A0A5J5EY21_9PEZI|nr:hypothetical protein FN846DRAFT_906781 [Sphaerosporella brunnea]
MASIGTLNHLRAMDPLTLEAETYHAQARAFPNVLAWPREISLPPLKFVVFGSPRIYFIPNDEIQTYQVVLDMYGDCVDEAGWPVLAFSWPYYTGKFTIIGAPLFSESLLTIELKPNRLAIKFAVPRPHHLTVGCLRDIVVEYMRQLGTAGELATHGISPSDVDSLYIEDATSSDLVQGLLNRASQACPKTPTLFAGLGVPSADVENEQPSDGTTCRFIALQMHLIKFPEKREPTQNILMVAAATISQVKSALERRFFGALRVDHDQWKDKTIVQHDVVVRSDDGRWTEVPDPDETTLGILQRPVQSVLLYRDYWQRA